MTIIFPIVYIYQYAEFWGYIHVFVGHASEIFKNFINNFSWCIGAYSNDVLFYFFGLERRCTFTHIYLNKTHTSKKKSSTVSHNEDIRVVKEAKNNESTRNISKINDNVAGMFDQPTSMEIEHGMELTAENNVQNSQDKIQTISKINDNYSGMFDHPTTMELELGMQSRDENSVQNSYDNNAYTKQYPIKSDKII